MYLHVIAVFLTATSTPAVALNRTAKLVKWLELHRTRPSSSTSVVIPSPDQVADPSSLWRGKRCYREGGGGGTYPERRNTH